MGLFKKKKSDAQYNTHSEKQNKDRHLTKDLHMYYVKAQMVKRSSCAAKNSKEEET